MSFSDLELLKANLLASQSPWVPDEFEREVRSLIEVAKTYRKGDSFTAEKCSSLFTTLCRKHSSKLIFKKKVKSYLNRSKIYNIASSSQTPVVSRRFFNLLLQEENTKNTEECADNNFSKFYEEASVPIPFTCLTFGFICKTC